MHELSNQAIEHVTGDNPYWPGAATLLRRSESRLESVARTENSNEGLQRALVEVMEVLMAPSMRVEPRVELSGRIKSRASVLEKALRTGLGVQEIRDVIGVRAMTRRTRSCYRLAERIREVFEVVDGQCDDYIAMPKPNGYRSLHLAIRLPCGSPVEIQIRTRWMHTICERNPPQYKRI